MQDAWIVLSLDAMPWNCQNPLYIKVFKWMITLLSVLSGAPHVNMFTCYRKDGKLQNTIFITI